MASCSAELVLNVTGSLVAPTMSAVAVAVAVMTSTSGNKKLVALRQILLIHWVAVPLGHPCLGYAGSHSPLTVHLQSAGCSARLGRHHLFLEMSGVISDR